MVRGTIFTLEIGIRKTYIIPVADSVSSLCSVHADPSICLQINSSQLFTEVSATHRASVFFLQPIRDANSAINMTTRQENEFLNFISYKGIVAQAALIFIAGSGFQQSGDGHESASFASHLFLVIQHPPDVDPFFNVGDLVSAVQILGIISRENEELREQLF